MSDDTEYLVMKLFSTTLTDVARRWYDTLLDKSIKPMDQLEETFLNRWSTKEDPSMLLARLTEIRESKNETIREFNVKFEKLFQQIPSSHHPRKAYLLFLYIKAFPVHFRYLLKDKEPTTMQEAQGMATKIEASLSSCKVEPFYASRTKADTKPETVHNVEPTQDTSTP